jgi:hypothetical protein
MTGRRTAGGWLYHAAPGMTARGTVRRAARPPVPHGPSEGPRLVHARRRNRPGRVPAELAAALSDDKVREMALQAAGLSDRSLTAITEMINTARTVEGLHDNRASKADGGWHAPTRTGSSSCTSQHQAPPSFTVHRRPIFSTQISTQAASQMALGGAASLTARDLQPRGQAGCGSFFQAGHAVSITVARSIK